LIFAEAVDSRADELTRIFVSSRETARRNLRARRAQSKIKNQRSKIF
jgi:hypothetical protein